jgi:membrane protein implicated in regulation of membrane protease activity
MRVVDRAKRAKRACRYLWLVLRLGGSALYRAFDVLAGVGVVALTIWAVANASWRLAAAAVALLLLLALVGGYRAWDRENQRAERLDAVATAVDVADEVRRLRVDVEMRGRPFEAAYSGQLRGRVLAAWDALEPSGERHVERYVCESPASAADLELIVTGLEAGAQRAAVKWARS